MLKRLHQEILDRERAAAAAAAREASLSPKVPSTSKEEKLDNCQQMKKAKETAEQTENKLIKGENILKLQVQNISNIL